MATNNDNPVTSPSGKYRFYAVHATPGKPTIHVRQRFSDGTWGPTPGQWTCDSLVNGSTYAPPVAPGARLALDYGAGWRLDEDDTAALLELARAALT